MSKENKKEMDLGDNILGFIDKMQDKYYRKKSDKRMNSFIKEARLLTEIESESFVKHLDEKGLKTSYLNSEGIRLACVSNGEEKTYSIAQDLALGENIFATWSYDEDNEVKDLNILDKVGFDFAIKTMKSAVEVMNKERLNINSLNKKEKPSNKRKNKPF